MRPAEHIALTGHTGFTTLNTPKFAEPTSEIQVPDFIATCNDCGYPVGCCSLVPEEYEYANTDDWISALRAEHYVNEVELSANGYDERIPLGWRPEFAYPPQNQAS